MLGRRVRTALLLLSIAAPCAAQIPASEYAARRAALAERIGTGVVLAFGATQPMNDAASYRQLPAFNYLTGFQEPDAAFLMVARDGRPSYAMLYVPARDPRMQLYDGFPPDSAETLARLGLGVRTLDALRPTLDTLVAAGLPVYSVWDFASRDYARTDSLTRGRRFIELLREAHPNVEVRDAHPHIDALRVVKSPAEIALLRKAVDITVAALEEAMRSVRPGMNEAELQTIIEFTFRRGGAEGPSFHSIIGSGPNFREILARRLAELGLIQSPDATIDPPWGGDCSRPNVRCTQAFLYMAHGLGHGIGLEVHDVGGNSYSPTGVFQEGEVITIEPGLYIGTHLLDMLPDTPKNRAFIAAVRPAVERYANIGVRIEDDYIVTATGAEWISRAPREIEEIEAVMRQQPGT